MQELFRKLLSPGLIGVLALGAMTPVHAAPPNVIASLTQPPGGLACSEAAGQTRVVFDFKQPRADLKQLSVFVNGEGVRKDAISEHWPRLTVLRGLHPGRNTVEIYATGADNKSEAHTLTVLVGEAPRRDDSDDVAIVDCVGARGQVAERDDEDDSAEPAGEVIAEASDDADEVIEDVRPEVDDEVEYVDAPVYVYHPYPVFRFVSFFPAYYYPWPYYGYYGYRSYPYGYGGYYRGHGYYHGGYRSHGGGSYWRGNPGHGSPGHAPSQPSRAPSHSAPPSRGGSYGGHGGDRGGHSNH